MLHIMKMPDMSGKARGKECFNVMVRASKLGSSIWMISDLISDAANTWVYYDIAWVSWSLEVFKTGCTVKN